MSNLVLPEKYAEALFELAQAKEQTAAVRAELELVLGSVRLNPGFSQVIKHPGISREEKKRLVSGIFEGKVSGITLNFIKLLIDRKRENMLEAICAVYFEKADSAAGIKKITIETAAKLEKAEHDKLLKKLEAAMKSRLVVDAKVNPEILGGIIIRDRMKLIDASVLQFLKSLKNGLKTVKVGAAKKKAAGRKAPAKKKPAKKKAVKKASKKPAQKPAKKKK